MKQSCSSVRCHISNLLTGGFRVVAIVALGLTMVVFRAGPALAATPPANDDFNNATVIATAPFSDTVDTTAATTAPDDPTSCGSFGMVSNTVWYSLTPTVTETINVSTAGSSYPAGASAYTGIRGSLTQVACGTPWTATAGVTYHIMVSTALLPFPGPGFGGTLVLHVTAATPPANDTFDNATVIPTVPFTTNEDISGATSAPDDPAGCGGTANSVWFSYTPPANETVSVAETEIPRFADISVFSGARGALSQVACNAGPLGGSASWPATAGVTYHIMVVTAFVPSGSVTVQVTATMPPANDDFNHATPVTSVPFTDNVNVSGATTAADDPMSCGAAVESVWYRFTPTVSETYSVNTTGSTYWTGVSVYTGTRGSLAQIGCQSGPFSTPVTWAGTAGVTYSVMVTNFTPFGPGSNDHLTLNVTGTMPPANDDIDHSTVVSTLPFADTVDVSGATAAADDPTSCQGMTASSVWYTFTPTVNEAIVADTSGSTYPAIVSAYTGSPGSLAQVACQDVPPTTTFPVKAGVTYHIMVANNQFSGPAGQLTLHLRAILPPANDDISHATAVTGLPFTDNVDTTAATAAPGDPTCFFQPSATVWYRYTAPASGTVELNSNGSSYIASVSAYSGTPAALTQIACGFQSTAPFVVAKGVTYYFMVASQLPVGGNLQFHVTALPDLSATSPCTTTLTGKIAGAVTVGSGTTCLNAATVSGAVIVRPGAQLQAVNSSISGALISDGATALTICNTSISGALTVRTSTGLVLIGDGGDGGGGNGACGGNTIGGALVVGGPSAVGNHSGVEMGGNRIGGQLMVSGNTVNPATVLAAEDATIEIEANHVGGGLGCAGNAPAPVNDGLVNIVSGLRSGQCQGL